MKKILMSSIVLTTFALSITLFEMSCKKEATAQTSTTLTREEILVQKTWKVDRLHHVIGGKYSTYTNGGINTTGTTYDVLRFTFKSDGTGTHTNENGATYQTTWQFSSADKRTLVLNVKAPTPFTNTWEMVELAGNYLHASTVLTVSGNSNNIETFRLVQIP